MMLAGSLLAAALLGALVPLKRPVLAFILISALLFTALVAIRTMTGFAGQSWEETLLLFNDSAAAFVGFNVQVTYRAFAGPVFVLGLLMLWRMRGSKK